MEAPKKRLKHQHGSAAGAGARIGSRDFRYRLIVGIAVVLALPLAVYAVLQGRAARLSYDFSDPDVVGRWQVLGEVIARRVTPAGLVLEAGGPLLLASPAPFASWSIPGNAVRGSSAGAGWIGSRPKVVWASSASRSKGKRRCGASLSSRSSRRASCSRSPSPATGRSSRSSPARSTSSMASRSWACRSARCWAPWSRCSGPSPWCAPGRGTCGVSRAAPWSSSACST